MRFPKPSFSPIKILVSLSLCLATTVPFASSASACQAGAPGCVLPVLDDPPPPPPPRAELPPVDDDGGVNWLPFLLGALALGGLLWLLLNDDEDEDVPISP